jgi:hypothetical protein
MTRGLKKEKKDSVGRENGPQKSRILAEESGMNSRKPVCLLVSNMCA